MDAGREIFWNIGAMGISVYILSSIAAAILFWEIYRRARLWKTGRPDHSLGDLKSRIIAFIPIMAADILGHRKFFRRPFPGVMHLILFWAIISFIALTAADFIHHYWFHFLQDRLYLWFSLVVDCLGLLAMLALLGFAFRRYLNRSRRQDSQPGDAIALGILFIFILTGFMVEGSRLAATEMIATPEYAPWSIGGFIFGKLSVGLGPWFNEMMHAVLWYFHLAMVIAGTIYVALSFSKLTHVLVAPINIFLRSLKPKGELLPIDFETSTEFGAGKMKDFTWKQLMELDACTRCGRCEESCPAHLSGKVLSPKKVMRGLKDCMQEDWHPFKSKKEQSHDGEGLNRNLIGDVIPQEALWDCTTCGACMEECPVCVEHVYRFIDMRRNQVLSDMKLPDPVRETLRNMEIRGHPWRGSESRKDEWVKGLNIQTLSEKRDAKWLYWVGCTGALVERNTLVTKALARQLQEGGIDFAILGNEEGCCGDPARRMGHELQYQMMAQQNIEVLKKYGVKKIVASCPHCYNTLKHEYRRFGGEFEVWHHSELLWHLKNEEKLTFGNAVNKVVTYHDACYLGRYNHIFNPPRELLRSIPGLKISEMESTREQSLCCGGGGGHAWMEEPPGKRVSVLRMQQALRTNADIIALACPFCLQMMEDAIADQESPMKAMDISELIAKTLVISKRGN